MPNRFINKCKINNKIQGKWGINLELTINMNYQNLNQNAFGIIYRPNF